MNTPQDPAVVQSITEVPPAKAPTTERVVEKAPPEVAGTPGSGGLGVIQRPWPSHTSADGRPEVVWQRRM